MQLLLDCGDDPGSHGTGTGSWYARIPKRLIDCPGIHLASVTPAALEVGEQILGNSCFGIKLIQRELVRQQSIYFCVVQATRTVNPRAESVSGQDGGGLADGLEEVTGGVALEGGGVAVGGGAAGLSGDALPEALKVAELEVNGLGGARGQGDDGADEGKDQRWLHGHGLVWVSLYWA